MSQATHSKMAYASPGKKMRLAGVVILSAGLLSAALLWGLSKPAEVLPDEFATPDNSKRAARDIGTQLGQMGVLSYSLAEKMKDPDVQAGLILAVSFLTSAGCFYIAHLQMRAKES